MFRDTEPFFVQENPRGVWHVETPDDPERMLCGVIIPVDSASAKIQKRWGTKPCPWCSHLLEKYSSGGSPR